MNNDVFTLQEGVVVLQYPAHMSPESYEYFTAFLDLIVRKAKRNSTLREGERSDNAIQKS